MALEVNGKSIETDNNGNLVNPNDWDEDVARALAAADDTMGELTQEHWDIINEAREYFIDNGSVCEPRAFSKIMKKKYGKDRSDQKYIYSLFPTGLIKCANKIAGLPRPKGCS